MWCRAKRIGKGERLDESVWMRVEGSDSCMSEESESDSDSEMRLGMKEAVERGYGSDREEGGKRKTQ